MPFFIFGEPWRVSRVCHQPPLLEESVALSAILTKKDKQASLIWTLWHPTFCNVFTAAVSKPELTLVGENGVILQCEVNCSKVGLQMEFLDDKENIIMGDEAKWHQEDSRSFTVTRRVTVPDNITRLDFSLGLIPTGILYNVSHLKGQLTLKSDGGCFYWMQLTEFLIPEK